MKSQKKPVEVQVETGNAKSYRKAMRVRTQNRNAHWEGLKEETIQDQNLQCALAEAEQLKNSPIEPDEEYTEPMEEEEILLEEEEVLPEEEYHGEADSHTEINIYKTVRGQKELKTLEELKEDFKNVYTNDGVIYQKDILKALDRLDMSDTDMDGLWDWFSEENIDVSEDEDIEAMEDDLELLEEDEEGEEEEEDEDEDRDEEEDDKDNIETPAKMNKLLSSAYSSAKTNTAVQLNDPVKMYLKEIGRVPLLKAEEETVIAKKIELGEKIKESLADVSKEEMDAQNQQVRRAIQRVKRRMRLDGLDDSDPSHEEIYAELPDMDPTRVEEMICIIEGEDARNLLINSNLRLVVSIAKKYVGRGMLFLDLIQEGNMGLVKAVEKFDYTKGFKFSTYATWWIRQAITRAIADQARTIRIPVHMVETINKLTRIQRQLVQELGRDPTAEEISARMDGISPDKVREIQKIALEPVSLETPIGEEDDSHLGDFIEDKDAMSPDEFANNQLLKDEINTILSGLTEREEKVLRLRFGLYDGRTRTLEEVGQEFNVTRERIRQIEAKAIRKLKHPTRSKRLKDFFDK